MRVFPHSLLDIRARLGTLFLDPTEFISGHISLPWILLDLLPSLDPSDSDLCEMIDTLMIELIHATFSRTTCMECCEILRIANCNLHNMCCFKQGECNYEPNVRCPGYREPSLNYHIT
jgi:hypothetical protein